MYSIQLDRLFHQFIQIFYRLRIWQRDEEFNSRKSGEKWCLKPEKLFYSVFGALHPIFFVVNAVLCEDQNESIFSIQTALVAAVIDVKLLYILFKKQDILALLNDRVVVHLTENRDEFRQANKKIQKFIKFVRLYCLALFITEPLLIIIQLPILSADKGLPLFVSFSWNDSEIIYWVAYLFVSLSNILCVIAILFTPLIWYIMLNYSIEYEFLGNKLRRLGGVGKKGIKTISMNQKNFISAQQTEYVKDLIVLIKEHRNLTGTIERFRSFFSTLFMGQIATSGICMCTSVYNLAFASKENIIQTEMYVVALLYALFDIFLIMYLANNITIASDRLSYCLFESNWIEQSESCKKYVLIMGEVLKQPQQLVVLIYPMNLETFTTIMNGAYSMFNILKSFK